MRFKVDYIEMPFEDEDGDWCIQHGLRIAVDGQWIVIASIENDMEQIAMSLQEALNVLAEKMK